jgi:hypothetical protein
MPSYAKDKLNNFNRVSLNYFYLLNQQSNLDFVASKKKLFVFFLMPMNIFG